MGEDAIDHHGRRRSRLLRSTVAPLVAAAGLALAACGGTTSTTTATTVAPTASVVAADDAVATAGNTAGQRNPGGVYGPYGVYERVQFPAGSSGTTVSDGVVRGSVNGYLFAADAGQTMTVDLVSENAVFDLYGPDDVLLTSGRSALVDPLALDGDHLVVVQSEFGNASFELIVEITGPAVPDDEGAAEATSCPVGYVEFDGSYPLRICHEGDTVSLVQQGLVDLGYGIAVDGFFGEETEAALADAFGDGVGEISSPADLEALLGCGDDC